MRSAPSDHDAVAAYQMAGQDVGWLLRHWATKKPAHPIRIRPAPIRWPVRRSRRSAG